MIHEENGEKRTVSYAQLLAAVRDRAEVLKSCAGRCEAILADGSYDCVVEVFAAVDAGLPVALLDANAPDEALTEQLNACDAGLVWGDEDLCEELGFAATGRTEAQLGDVLFFTSGTTHRAKAVVLTEQS
ncbi:MAG: AMP-binding protein, partial [Firmicutes bacterium]|nr:AMP-binding protein [Bacillota bacterium]